MTDPATKELYDRLLAEMDRRYEQRFADQERAVRVAEAMAEKWRDNANEWRSAMSERESKFLTRGEALIQFTTIEQKLDSLQRSRDEAGGRFRGAPLLVSVGGLLIAVAAVIVAIVR